ncbi:MAG: DUF2304 domain-containing protein [Lactococcus lactis]|uniref:DUF2304 domain-containing protein n=1 Tax=Lactococcus lactis TaxID=1358 RepID=A0A9Q7JP17_9LACT|nr:MULTISPECIES: DUF2304 domain-containing protein [Lactococcus]MCA2390888.1 DUF2304 domain-containing protein [Lactococcus sp. NH2-7C]MCO0829388.1 DUF2304 domain-containing protein [Lactococcus lactis]MCT1182811.1 DUF2304 domain-containing protein [Lactococcus lactis]MCT1191517.1 DUF2304 domain-containing protein [Lactococcus lactis]MCT1193265.1 DUF2304 domain-containing protein [Lactococcus lactis]
MPLPLRILAIILAVLFFIYTIRLIRKNLAEVRHMLKWFILALVILFGAIFSEFAAKIAYALGVTTLTSFALFVLVGMLLVISIRYQISLIAAEKQIKTLIQEVSLLRKDMKDTELGNNETKKKVSHINKNLE